MKFHYIISQKNVLVFFFTILCMMIITSYPSQFLLDLELVSQKQNDSFIKVAFATSGDSHNGHSGSRGGGDDDRSKSFSSRGGGDDDRSGSDRKYDDRKNEYRFIKEDFSRYDDKGDWRDHDDRDRDGRDHDDRDRDWRDHDDRDRDGRDHDRWDHDRWDDDDDHHHHHKIIKYRYSECLTQSTSIPLTGKIGPKTPFLIGDFYPCELKDGRATLNIPETWDLQFVVMHIDRDGEDHHGIAADMEKIQSLSKDNALYVVNLDDSMEGEDPLTGEWTRLNDINAIALYNYSEESIDFKLGNSLAITAVLKRS